MPLPFGPYQLVRKIGVGGMGEVYLAVEQGPDGPRACVVKKVLPHLTAQTQFVHRFLDEARVAVRLRHPNIARVHSMGEVEGEYYLSMEYVQGKTLSRFGSRLREQGASMPVGLVLLAGELVCAGLSHAHAATDDHGQPLQLVHRDLSPANVCVSYDGEVKIIDFGAAHSTLKEAQTAPRVVIGNLAYMAPEQARKRWVDGRADVYSLGAVLWELLTNQGLAQDGDPIERWRKAANPDWARPSTLRADVPTEVDDVVLRALSIPVDGRWPDAASFGMALGALRARFAPDASEEQLGELLRRTFSRESAAEIAVLKRMLEGDRPAPPVATPARGTGTRPRQPPREDPGSPARSRTPAPSPRRSATEPREPRVTGSLRVPARTPAPLPATRIEQIDQAGLALPATRIERIDQAGLALPATRIERLDQAGFRPEELASELAPDGDETTDEVLGRRPAPPVAGPSDIRSAARQRQPVARSDTPPPARAMRGQSDDEGASFAEREEAARVTGEMAARVMSAFGGGADEMPSEVIDEPPTSSYDTLGRRRALLIGGTIFLAALAMGLFVVLWLRR